MTNLLQEFFEHTVHTNALMELSDLFLQDLIDKVTDFQNEALDALHEETPDSEKLAKLIEFGVTLDVDLPEIPKLKQVNVHVSL